ncbi:MAG TPA: hypothetical protein VEW03_04285 [Longimicrobiaceae bacterium]|nr:hypothetical protein [Longimicrobiaceae bacterium]
MRKVLILTAALALCAAPTLAQQQPADAAAAPEQSVAVKPAPAPQADAPVKPAPSLAVGTDEVRQDVRAAESQRAQREAQVGANNWWYLVAAIAVGVIIAALVLD